MKNNQIINTKKREGLKLLSVEKLLRIAIAKTGSFHCIAFGVYCIYMV